MTNQPTYSVSVKPDPKALPLYACIEEPTGAIAWWEQRGRRLTAAQKDTAITEALAAGLPYVVTEHDGQTAGGRVL